MMLLLLPLLSVLLLPLDGCCHSKRNSKRNFCCFLGSIFLQSVDRQAHACLVFHPPLIFSSQTSASTTATMQPHLQGLEVALAATAGADSVAAAALC
jgi:hypothetical protein